MPDTAPKDELDAETWVFYASALEAENAALRAELQQVKDERAALLDSIAVFVAAYRGTDTHYSIEEEGDAITALTELHASLARAALEGTDQ